MSTRSYKYGRKAGAEDDGGGYGGSTFSFGGVTVQRQTYSDDDEYGDENGLTNMSANDFQYGYYEEEDFSESDGRDTSDDQDEE